jgi:hypothetical protein
MSNEFETDKDGNVILRPVTGWTMAPVAEMSVLLAIEYAETPEELENGTTHRMQFGLLPQECLRLAEALTRQAQRLLEPHSGSPLM